MENKGFTLIELLGVIILLSLIMIFAFPKITNSTKDSADNVDDVMMDLIYKASTLYIADNENDFSKTNGNSYCITFEELVTKNYLKSPITFASNDIDLTNIKSVEVTYNNGFTYQIKDKENCVTKLYGKCNFSEFVANPGDINNDGEINASDGTMLSRFISGWDIELDCQGLLNSDYNGDGLLDLKDVQLLSRFLAKWSGDNLPGACNGVNIDSLNLLAGDVDGNGEINASDGTMLSRFISGWDIELDCQGLLNSDVNGDGEVNLLDYDLITNFLSKWGVSLKLSSLGY